MPTLINAGPEPVNTGIRRHTPETNHTYSVQLQVGETVDITDAELETLNLGAGTGLELVG